MLVDVHCHLTHELFKKDLDEVIQRAKSAGVKAIVCSGVNHPTNLEALELAKKYDIIKCTLGLYPIDLLGLMPDETGLTRQLEPIPLEEEFEFIKKNKENIAGVGECGLDFHWDKEQHDKQKENFQKIIGFAEKLNKPIVIHSRKAEGDIIEMLQSSTLKKVVLHCFEGRKHIIKKAIDMNYSFSIPCSILKMQHFQLLVEAAPIQQLLTETDAPWLSPFPGKRNEPANVIETVKKIAEIKVLSLEETQNLIFMNYQRMFL